LPCADDSDAGAAGGDWKEMISML